MATHLFMDNQRESCDGSKGLAGHYVAASYKHLLRLSLAFTAVTKFVVTL
jgi:hypothetical protein